MRRAVVSLAVLVALLAFAASALAAGDPLRPRQWGLDMIGADAAHRTATGEGAVVAVVDSGVLAGHPDLAGRLVAGHDYVQDDETPQDGDGHGTHVTGIIVADTGNNVGVGSVAPGAKVMPVRVLGDDGSGEVDDVTAGVNFAVDHGAQVINLSLGPELPIVGGDAGFDAAVDRALDKGIVVVAAAGNSSLPVCDQPAAEGRLLCVGAVDKRRSRSFFSNFGDGLGIVAPGGSGVPITDEDILSTWNDGGYEELAGTSQASPHVAGVAALLVSLGLRGQDVVQRILATARDVGPAGPDPQYGAGIVDAAAAVNGLTPGGGSSGGGSGGAGGGAGGAPGGSAGTAGSAARITIARALHVATLLRHGLRVRCTAVGRGRCAVRATLGGRLVASASRAVQAGRSTLVVARARGRARARLRALRRATRLTVRITLPGAPPQVRRVLLRR
jgi:subtilisin family serine protease